MWNLLSVLNLGRQSAQGFNGIIFCYSPGHARHITHTVMKPPIQSEAGWHKAVSVLSPNITAMVKHHSLLTSRYAASISINLVKHPTHSSPEALATGCPSISHCHCSIRPRMLVDSKFKKIRFPLQPV